MHGSAAAHDNSKYVDPMMKAPSPLFDIGINITHRALRNHWRNVVQRAIDAGVTTMLLTGTSLRSSIASLEIARTWSQERGKKNLFCSVGVHPHDAKDFEPKWGINSCTDEDAKAATGETKARVDETGTIDVMRELLTKDPLAVAVGECGLDYNRNFSPKSDQIHAFREQVVLACEIGMPLFVHERQAHKDLIDVLDSVQSDVSTPSLPPVVVHCFTGTAEEAKAYIDRGYYIGFTGTICKKERGASLRDLLPSIPLSRIMVETDAPFMGFVKGRHKHSEPAHVVGVAEEIARVLGVSVEDVCTSTTRNARQFFRL